MIVVISGPSGVGKSTITHELLTRQSELTFSISHTTRALRGVEQDGVDYHFVSADQFEHMIEEGAFAEHASVFKHRYGTAKSTLDQMEARGLFPLLDIDYQGAEQINASYPDAISIIIVPPSLPELQRRLRGRKTDNEEQLAIRLAKAQKELSHYTSFKYFVVNDIVNEAVSQIETILSAERCLVTRSGDQLHSLISGVE